MDLENVSTGGIPDEESFLSNSTSPEAEAQRRKQLVEGICLRAQPQLWLLHHGYPCSWCLSFPFDWVPQSGTLPLLSTPPMFPPHVLLIRQCPCLNASPCILSKESPSFKALFLQEASPDYLGMKCSSPLAAALEYALCANNCAQQFTTSVTLHPCSGPVK